MKENPLTPLDVMNTRNLIRTLSSNLTTSINNILLDSIEENTNKDIVIQQIELLAESYLKQLKDKNIIIDSNLTTHKYDSFTVCKGKCPKILLSYSNDTSHFIEKYHRMRNPTIRRLKMYARLS